MRAEGRQVIALDNVTSPVFALQHTLRGGTYAYVPRVWAMTPQIARAMAALPYGWVRFDAQNVDAVRICAQASGKKIVAAPHDMQPRHNLIISLADAPAEILAAMKPKTRYNIRLAEKKGVVVRPLDDAQEQAAFFALVDATAQRKGVRFHAHAHYRAILTHLPSDMVTLYGAFYCDTLIAANIVTFYDETATYLHGATSDEHRDVMAPFALQWRAMCDAKARQCAWYDFGGVFPDTADSGRRGITRFKMGFAPKQTSPCTTAGSYDMINAPVHYTAYRVAQRLARIFS